MARHGLVTASIAVVLVLAGGATASAHPFLVRSDPADGAVVAPSPGRVVLWFSEDVATGLSGLDLTDAAGRTLVTLDALPAPTPNALVFELPDLAYAVYGAAWRTLSEDDGHETTGLLVFRVGPGAAPTPSAAGGTAGPTSRSEASLRWIDLVALTTLIGGIAIGGWVLRAGAFGRIRAAREVPRARRRAVIWAVVAAGVAVGVAVANLVREAVVVSAPATSRLGTLWDLLTGTRWGWLWLVRTGLLAAIVLVGGAALRRPDRALGRDAPTILAPPTVLVAVMHVWSGHAPGATAPAVTIAVGTIHLLAAGVWLGGLAVLVLVWPWREGRQGSDAGLTRLVLRRFGVVAAPTVGVLVATGVFAAGREVATRAALTTSGYGRVVLVKTGLVAVTLAIGGMNAIRSRRRADEAGDGIDVGRRRVGRDRGLLVTEVGLGLVVLAAAGILTASTPARGPAFERAEASPSVATRIVDDLVVTLSLRPNLPGDNVFEVLAVSTRRPPLAGIGEVALRLTSPDGRVVTTPALEEVAPGRFRLGGRFVGTPGGWRIEATIERPGLPRDVAAFDWSVAPAATAPAAPGEPLEPLATGTSIVLLAAVIAATSLAVARRRMRRRWRPSAPATSRRLARGGAS